MVAYLRSIITIQLNLIKIAIHWICIVRNSSQYSINVYLLLVCYRPRRHSFIKKIQHNFLPHFTLHSFHQSLYFEQFFLFKMRSNHSFFTCHIIWCNKEILFIVYILIDAYFPLLKMCT